MRDSNRHDEFCQSSMHVGALMVMLLAPVLPCVYVAPEALLAKILMGRVVKVRIGK